MLAFLAEPLGHLASHGAAGLDASATNREDGQHANLHAYKQSLQFIELRIRDLGIPAPLGNDLVARHRGDDGPSTTRCWDWRRQSSQVLARNLAPGAGWPERVDRVRVLAVYD